MELHLEGRRAIITHEGERYECSSPLMRPGDDGLIVGRKQIAPNIRVDFRRSEGTVIATVYEAVRSTRLGRSVRHHRKSVEGKSEQRQRKTLTRLVYTSGVTSAAAHVIGLTNRTKPERSPSVGDGDGKGARMCVRLA